MDRTARSEFIMYMYLSTVQTFLHMRVSCSCTVHVHSSHQTACNYTNVPITCIVHHKKRTGKKDTIHVKQTKMHNNLNNIWRTASTAYKNKYM